MELGKLYIKFRMFFIVNSVFWSKMDYYLEAKNYSLKEAYLRSRYMSGLKPDFNLEKRDKNKWREEISLFDSLTHQQKIDRGLIIINERRI